MFMFRSGCFVGICDHFDVCFGRVILEKWSPNLKLYAPATKRNREPLLAVLRSHLPERGTVLEISSGTGQHAAYFTPRLAPLWWLPSDITESNLSSIEAWCSEAKTNQLLSPIRLDVTDSPWAVEEMVLPSAVSAIVNFNMLHITPWECCEALFLGAERLLQSQGTLILYGPFRKNQRHTAPSNEVFDARLRAQNLCWGIRDLEAVLEVAKKRHFNCSQVISMPANNLSLVFQCI